MARTPQISKCCSTDHMSRKTLKSCKKYHPRLRCQRVAARILDDLKWNFRGTRKEFDDFLSAFGKKVHFLKFQHKNQEDIWELSSRAKDGLGIGCSCASYTNWVEDIDTSYKHLGWEKVTWYWDEETQVWYKAAPGGYCNDTSCFTVSLDDLKGLFTILGKITSQY